MSEKVIRLGVGGDGTLSCRIETWEKLGDSETWRQRNWEELALSLRSENSVRTFLIFVISEQTVRVNSGF